MSTKAVIETNGEKHLPEESADVDSTVSFAQSTLNASDNNACQSTDDDDDDRVLFNADIVCSEHGELQILCSVRSFFCC